MHYESFDLVLTEPREVGASFGLDVFGGAKKQVWTEHVRPILGAIAVAYGAGLSRAAVAGISDSSSRRSSRSGSTAFLRDLYEAETAELAPPISSLLRDLARVIAHEANGLAIFSHRTTPALLAQQVCNRARSIQLTALEQHARAWLAQRGQPYLALRWSSGGHSVRHRREWPAGTRGVDEITAAIRASRPS